jgi:hypothetical protein
LKDARLRDILVSNSKGESSSLLNRKQAMRRARFVIDQIKWHPRARQVSGHEFTLAVQPKIIWALAPVQKDLSA